MLEIAVKNEKVDYESLLMLLPGDVVELLPLEEPEAYKYYKMPSKPSKFVFVCVQDIHDFGGSEACTIVLWKRGTPNSWGSNKFLSLSYLDRSDCRTLYFCGQQTCETHEYGLRLVKFAPNEPEAMALKLALTVVEKAINELCGFRDFEDVAGEALNVAGRRHAENVRNYLLKRVKEFVTGKEYPMFCA